ncbi:hypothetical protein SDC9_148157 [bioreactor metagenome]|uniref:Uncharacterized protein n=1 Tax=bioreactor metagenome TaxID=1076179 RepID=A0A645EII8_9ZZZZ
MAHDRAGLLGAGSGDGAQHLAKRRRKARRLGTQAVRHVRAGRCHAGTHRRVGSHQRGIVFVQRLHQRVDGLASQVGGTGVAH